MVVGVGGMVGGRGAVGGGRGSGEGGQWRGRWVGRQSLELEREERNGMLARRRRRQATRV